MCGSAGRRAPPSGPAICRRACGRSRGLLGQVVLDVVECGDGTADAFGAVDDAVDVDEHVAAVVDRARVAPAGLDEPQALAFGHAAQAVLTDLVGSAGSHAGNCTTRYAGRYALGAEEVPAVARAPPPRLP